MVALDAELLGTRVGTVEVGLGPGPNDGVGERVRVGLGAGGEVGPCDDLVGELGAGDEAVGVDVEVGLVVEVGPLVEDDELEVDVLEEVDELDGLLEVLPITGGGIRTDVVRLEALVFVVDGADAELLSAVVVVEAIEAAVVVSTVPSTASVGWAVCTGWLPNTRPWVNRPSWWKTGRFVSVMAAATPLADRAATTSTEAAPTRIPLRRTRA